MCKAYAKFLTPEATRSCGLGPPVVILREGNVLLPKSRRQNKHSTRHQLSDLQTAAESGSRRQGSRGYVCKLINCFLNSSLVATARYLIIVQGLEAC